MSLQQRVEQLVCGAAGYVQGCYYVVRVGEGQYLAGADSNMPWVVGVDQASTFGSAVSAAAMAVQWSNTATIERVTP